MHTHHIVSIYLFTFMVFLLVYPVSLLAEDSAVYQWQKKRLMQPSDVTLQREQSQQEVFIYENLKLEDIEKALDEHFARMDNMMFIGTILPPTAAGGKPKQEDDCE